MFDFVVFFSCVFAHTFDDITMQEMEVVCFFFPPENNLNLN